MRSLPADGTDVIMRAIRQCARAKDTAFSARGGAALRRRRSVRFVRLSTAGEGSTGGSGQVLKGLMCTYGYDVIQFEG